MKSHDNRKIFDQGAKETTQQAGNVWYDSALRAANGYSSQHYYTCADNGYSHCTGGAKAAVVYQ